MEDDEYSEENIRKHLKDWEENLEEDFKQMMIEEAVKHQIFHLEEDLKKFLILTHTTEDQKELQLSLMENLITYRTIMEDLKEE